MEIWSFGDEMKSLQLIFEKSMSCAEAALATSKAATTLAHLVNISISPVHLDIGKVADGLRLRNNYLRGAGDMTGALER